MLAHLPHHMRVRDVALPTWADGEELVRRRGKHFAHVLILLAGHMAILVHVDLGEAISERSFGKLIQLQRAVLVGIIGFIDAADIVLVDDEIKELPHLMALAKRMMVTINFNLAFSMALNFLAIVLAIMGFLNPVVGALVHNAGSVFVIVNSAILLKWSKVDK